MSRGGIDAIWRRVRFGEYDMSLHAMEEMAEDDLDIIDVETATADRKVTGIDKGPGLSICCSELERIAGWMWG